jgi:hypothetical protein
VTKEEAIIQLKETRDLSTGLLEPLGIGFENFLRFAQLDKKYQDRVIDKLIKILEGRV